MINFNKMTIEVRILKIIFEKKKNYILKSHLKSNGDGESNSL